MGWDFLGRVRGNVQYSTGYVFKKAVDLYKEATKTPRFMGTVFLGKRNKLVCQMYLYKGKAMKQKQKDVRQGKRHSSRASKKFHKAEDKRARKKAHDPWLIVSSKPAKRDSAKKVMAGYKKRMKIELEFRSTKNRQFGVGLDMARSRSEKRLEILLLIGALATFMLWLTGLAAEKKSLQYAYQANTIRRHRVLSVIYLGMQVVRQAKNEITIEDLQEILEKLKTELITC